MTIVRVKAAVTNPVEKADGSPLPFLGLEDLESRTGRLLATELPTKEAEDSVLHRDGDVLFSKLRPYLAKSYLPVAQGSATGELLVLRPGPKVDRRFLFYLTLSQPWIEWANTTAYGTKMPRTSWELISGYRMWLPELEEQRRIADFLDTETARMDRLSSHLAQFDRDVQERERAILGTLLNGQSAGVGESLGGWRWTPLMHLTDQLRPIMYGIVLPGPNVDNGVPIVKGGDVAANRLSAASLNKTTREIEAGYARSRLKGGDLVIAIRGSVGEVAVVPDELTGANLTQDAARISIGSRVSPTWLRLVLESPAVVYQIQQRVTGATIKGINIWDLKRVLIPTPDPDQQTALAARASRELDKHEALRTRVARHRKLITERRQALITAAVTGRFDVSAATGRGPEEGLR
ncbi:hypothetical protein AB0F68_06630 [Micromonospora sp. NPDC023966]|uniref:restriction endonuclease subunit S n=1 Tax=Micromonospora sp. NPDC023966 TaxID=3154699 RepID=UPI0033D32CB4